MTMDNLKFIELNAFLRIFAKVPGTGGSVKLLIREGNIKVNGNAETQNKRKLLHGDKVEYLGKEYVVDEKDLKENHKVPKS